MWWVLPWSNGGGCGGSMVVVIETFWVRTARFPCGQSVNWRKKKFCYLIVILLFLVCAQCKSWLDYGQNDQISLFTEIYINLPLFQKCVRIYHFLGVWVFHTWVLWNNNLQICKKFFDGTWVNETWVP